MKQYAFKRHFQSTRHEDAIKKHDKEQDRHKPIISGKKQTKVRKYEETEITISRKERCDSHAFYKMTDDSDHTDMYQHLTNNTTIYKKHFDKMTKVTVMYSSVIQAIQSANQILKCV